MNLVELRKQIKSNSLNNLYVFTGEETKIMKIFLEQMAEAKNCEIVPLESAVNFYNKLGVNSLVKKPAIYIITDDVAYTKQTEAVWNKVLRLPKNSPEIVVFIYNNLDKRIKFYKFFEKFIVEFVKLSENVVASYLIKDYKISKYTADYIVKCCKANYTMSLLELNKLLCYKNLHEISEEDAFSCCKEEGILVELKDEDCLQNFINHFLGKEFIVCFNQMDMFDLKVDPPLKILAYLYNSFRALFDVVAYESGLSYKKGESVSNFWAVKNVEIFGLQWSIKQVYEMLKYLQSLEKDIKTGNVEPDKVLKLLLVQSYNIVKLN